MYLPYIFLLVSVSLLITAFILYRYDSISGGFIAPLIFGFGALFGSILTSVEMSYTYKDVPVEVNITRTPRMVIVDDGLKLWEFESYIDVNNINDSTQFIYSVGHNIYGFPTHITIKYTNK
jgi:hypothetical protein